MRKFLSWEATDSAMDNAGIGTVRRLNELLDFERLARKEAEARSDQFAKERNELAAAVGRMEGKIEALTSHITQLTDKVTSQSAEIARLRTKLGGLNRWRDAKLISSPGAGGVAWKCG
ncbi:DUF3450 domain-containing protein [Pseudomonas syringae]|uniref:DUF3450 domain-containing protein n=1 Tax=Pseudomonas syringae TaxID=317 RepID=UPI001F418E80|nr:DUF3450 domain-containing protein [Pseudomonas syringae]